MCLWILGKVPTNCYFELLKSAVGSCIICADDARGHVIKCENFIFIHCQRSGLLTSGLLFEWPFVRIPGSHSHPPLLTVQQHQICILSPYWTWQWVYPTPPHSIPCTFHLQESSRERTLDISPPERRPRREVSKKYQGQKPPRSTLPQDKSPLSAKDHNSDSITMYAKTLKLKTFTNVKRDNVLYRYSYF